VSENALAVSVVCTGDLLSFVGSRHLASETAGIVRLGMEYEEPRQRREAIAALASVRLRGRGARRSSDAWLRREILDAFARQRAGSLGQDRQVGVKPDPI
jgi:hypothetical protein